MKLPTPSVLSLWRFSSRQQDVEKSVKLCCYDIIDVGKCKRGLFFANRSVKFRAFINNIYRKLDLYYLLKLVILIYLQWPDA